MNQTLVHIAAPSSFHDDCRYLAQADAILQTFYPSTTHDQENENETENSFPHDPPLAPARLAPDSFDSPVSVIPESPLASFKRSPPLPSPIQERHPKRPCPPPQEPPDNEQEQLKTPLTINPQQPPIASTPFTTHITPTLSLLANRLNLARTFVPAHQARPLHVLERGYWWLRLRLRLHDPLGSGLGTRYPRSSGRGWTGRASGAASTATIAHANNAAAGVNPNTWDRELFSRFWGFLEDFIANEGRAGWGVWCVLEREERVFGSAADRDLVPDRGRDLLLHHHPTPHPSNPDAGNFVLKVYTWGEIAPHVYLLLYLASERRIRGMGSQWRDASEGIVIQMA